MTPIQQMLLGVGAGDVNTWVHPVDETRHSGTTDNQPTQGYGTIGVNSAGTCCYVTKQSFLSGKFQGSSGYTGWPYDFRVWSVNCVDSNGERLWQKEIMFNEDLPNKTFDGDLGDCNTKLIGAGCDIDDSGNVYAVTWAREGSWNRHDYMYMMFLIKINSSGNIVEKKIVGPGAFNSLYGNASDMEAAMVPQIRILANGKLLLVSGYKSNTRITGISYQIFDSNLDCDGDWGQWAGSRSGHSQYSNWQQHVHCTQLHVNGNSFAHSIYQSQGNGQANSSYYNIGTFQICGTVASNGTITWKRFWRSGDQDKGENYGIATNAANTVTFHVKGYEGGGGSPANSTNKMRYCTEIFKSTLHSGTSRTSSNYNSDSVDWKRPYWYSHDAQTHRTNNDADAKMYDIYRRYVNIEYDETNGYLYFVGNSQKDKWGGWKRIPSITKINASNGDIEWTRSIYPWNMFGSNRLTTGDTRIRDMKLSDDHVYGIATTGEENMYGRSWVNGSGGNFEAKRERTFVFRMPKDGSGAVAYDSSTNYTNWVYHTNAVDVAVMSNTNNSAYNSWSEAGSWPRIGHNESNGGAQGFSNVTNGNWDTYVGTSQSDMWHDQNWTTAALTAQNGTKTHELIKLE